MTDYYRLITRAFATKGADEDKRAALYECAREALVKELSGVTPPLTELEITRERLALEAAIREIERTLIAAKLESSHATPASILNRNENAAQAPENRSQDSAADRGLALSTGALEALNAYRQSVAQAQRLSDEEVSLPSFAGTAKIAERGADIKRNDGGAVSRPSRIHETPELGPHVYMRTPRPPVPQRQDPEAILPDGSRKVLFTALVSGFVIAALLTVLYWQRDQLSAVLFRRAASVAQHDAVRPNPEILGSIGRTAKQDSSAADRTPLGLSPDRVAQRAFLYEEDPADANGKRYVGSVVWRTEPVSPREPVRIRAQLEVPERRISMTISLRANTDKTLPASHTIEIMFKVSPDFPYGGISNVLGILMKEAEQTRGAPLAVASVKIITDGVFLIGLSATESDMQRNRELLDGGSWFDIPIVYDNGRRAILAIEKGTPGGEALKEAFTAWQ